MFHVMKHPVIITSKGEVTQRDKYTRGLIISQYLSSSSGRMKLAQSMVQPLRTGRDYQGVARKIFAVEPMPLPSALTFTSASLPSGNLPVYNTDPEVPAEKFKHDVIRISSRGRVYRKGRDLGGRRVTFPTFELYANPSIKIGDVKRRRFNIIDRNVQKLKQSIMAEEDSSIFEILDKIGKNG